MLKLIFQQYCCGVKKFKKYDNIDRWDSWWVPKDRNVGISAHCS